MKEEELELNKRGKRGSVKEEWRGALELVLEEVPEEVFEVLEEALELPVDDNVVLLCSSPRS